MGNNLDFAQEKQRASPEPGNVIYYAKGLKGEEGENKGGKKKGFHKEKDFS
jgi:hypothetical protein